MAFPVFMSHREGKGALVMNVQKSSINIDELIKVAKRIGAKNIGITDNHVSVAWDNKILIWEKDENNTWKEITTDYVPATKF
jgi:hypothetical protein